MFAKKLILIFMFILFASFLNAKTLTFGVVPQQSPQKLIKAWSPVIDYLQKKTSYDIVLRIEKSIPEFEKKLYKGEYDLAYMNPYHYVLAHKRQNYKAFIRAKKNIVGILVANKEITINPQNLKNKTFLFPAPYAFAATLLTKYELKQKYGFDVEKNAKVLYVNSHDSVYKGIARGIGDLGGGIERTFKLLNDEKAKQNLTIIYKTQAYPSHPIAYSQNLPQDTIQSLQNAFLNMPKELSAFINIKTFINTDDAEYNSIRKISKSLDIE